MTAEWSLQLLSTARVIIFSPLSFGISWNEIAQSKSPCPAAFGDWKMILNQTLCSLVQKGEEERRKEKKHQAATNEENGWGPAGERERGGSGKSHTHTHTQAWNTTQTHAVTDVHARTRAVHSERALDITRALKKKKDTGSHTCYHDTNGLWLESISQKTSDTNGNHISDLVGLRKDREGLDGFPFFCRK